MNRKIVVAILVAVVAMSSVAALYYYFRRSIAHPTERIRDEAIQYMKAKHPETAEFMKDLYWSGGRATPHGLVGAETYEYEAKGWVVTIKYPVVPNPEYSVTADYSVSRVPGYVGIPYRIIWKGTYQDGIITEISYVFAQ